MPRGTCGCRASRACQCEARVAHGTQHSLSPLYQEMLSKARAGDTGVKLEVNER